MASASARLLLWWQRSIPGPSDSVHGQLSLRCLHPPIAVLEQQRTSCSSAGSAHRGLSGQMPARPHSSLAGPDRGEGDCDGGDGGGGGGNNNNTNTTTNNHNHHNNNEHNHKHGNNNTNNNNRNSNNKNSISNNNYY